MAGDLIFGPIGALAVIVVWLLLQAVVLPRLGIRT